MISAKALAPSGKRLKGHKTNNRDLHNHHQRKERPEVPVVRLMMEHMHPNGATGRAKKASNQEQGAFRHPALMLPGTLLVISVYPPIAPDRFMKTKRIRIRNYTIF